MAAILHCTNFSVKADFDRHFEDRHFSALMGESYNPLMYIVAIAWLYVTLLMAATETSVVAGVMSFLVYGAAPLALFLWVFGTPQRRRNQAKRENAAADSDSPD
jgi:hypothetical protein